MTAARKVFVRITEELRDEIDAARPSTTSRDAWVRAACEAALNPAVNLRVSTQLTR